jgi:hypothetical protein
VRARSVGASSTRIERRLRRALVAVAMLAALLAIAVAAVLLYWRAYLLGPSGDPFTRGPYLVSVTGDAAELRWRISDDAEVVVTASAPDGTTVTGEQGRLAGLQPGTRYTWVASVDDIGRAAGSFTTAPPDLGEPVTLAVLADYGSGSDHEYAVGATAAAIDPALAVTAGDNSYLSAHPDVLDRNIFQPLETLLREAPMYVGLGDHDGFWPGPDSLVAAFGIPRDGRYVVAYGPIQVLHLGERSDAAAIALAREALARPGFARRFAVLHVPLQPGDPLLAVLRDGGVDAVFAGHLHRYERRVVDGVLNFTVGTGGQGPGDLEFTPETADSDVSLLDFGFLRVEAGEDAVRYAFIDERGQVLDRLERP